MRRAIQTATIQFFPVPERDLQVRIGDAQQDGCAGAQRHTKCEVLKVRNELSMFFREITGWSLVVDTPG